MCHFFFLTCRHSTIVWLFSLSSVLSTFRHPSSLQLCFCHVLIVLYTYSCDPGWFSRLKDKTEENQNTAWVPIHCSADVVPRPCNGMLHSAVIVVSDAVRVTATVMNFRVPSSCFKVRSMSSLTQVVVITFTRALFSFASVLLVFAVYTYRFIEFHPIRYFQTGTFVIWTLMRWKYFAILASRIGRLLKLRWSLSCVIYNARSEKAFGPETREEYANMGLSK